MWVFGVGPSNVANQILPPTGPRCRGKTKFETKWDITRLLSRIFSCSCSSRNTVLVVVVVVVVVSAFSVRGVYIRLVTI